MKITREERYGGLVTMEVSVKEKELVRRNITSLARLTCDGHQRGATGAVDGGRGAAQAAGGAEGGEGGAGVPDTTRPRALGGNEDSPGPRALHHRHLVTPGTQTVSCPVSCTMSNPESCPVSCPVSYPESCPMSCPVSYPESCPVSSPRPSPMSSSSPCPTERTSP